MKARILLLFAALAVPASAAHWNVDAAKSKLGFTVPWGNAPYAVAFKNWNADIDFDPADLTHSHVVATIATGSLTSGDDDTDKNVRADKGFRAATFPEAKFESRSFTHQAGDHYVATGTLSIRGATRPVTLPFTLTISGGTAHMVGSAQVKWAEFGMGQGMGSEMPPIAPVVTITIDLTATQKN
ncbi:MAG TPA: YceI family protein [Rhizomicrobium sp.]